MIELWDLQQDAVELARGKTGFAIFDDMGLGKTVTALAIVKDRWIPHGFSEPGPVLIFTLKGMVHHWWRHIHAMFDESYYQYFHVHHWETLLDYERIEDETRLSGYRIETSAGAWLKDWRGRVQHKIVDESHKMKDHKGQQSKAIRSIKAQFTIHLSGTPYPNGMAYELWSGLNDLYPKVHTSYWRHFNTYTSYTKHTRGECDCGNWHTREWREIHGNKNEDKLREILRPIAVARQKKGCMCSISAPIGIFSHSRIRPHDHLGDLPDVLSPVTYEIELSEQQIKAYEGMRDKALAWVGEHEDQPLPAPIAIAQLTRLRQFASAYIEIPEGLSIEQVDWGIDMPPSLHVAKMREPSPKLDALMEVLADTLSPVVVFTMFRQMIDLAVKRFDKAKISYIRYDGTTKNQTIWEDFQAGKARVFISTIQKGGEAIELFRSFTVVFLDRSWVPKDNNQARDRLWRNGQKNAVQPIYIQAKGTVDEVIEERVIWKTANIKKLLGG
jgi:SNF2 family DNA or RNA helicase